MRSPRISPDLSQRLSLASGVVEILLDMICIPLRAERHLPHSRNVIQTCLRGKG